MRISRSVTTMVVLVSCLDYGRAIGKIPDVSDVRRDWQRLAIRMRIRRRVTTMVVLVSCLDYGRAIGKVSNICNIWRRRQRSQGCRGVGTPSSCAADKSCCCRLLLPVEGRSLDRRFTSVAELLLPSWVDLISVFLESKESSFDFLVCLGVLDHAI